MKNAFAPINLTLCAAWLVAGIANAQTNHYVWLGGGHVSPYTNWAMAATNIQSAVNASAVGAVIWVTNGVYETGVTNARPDQWSAYIGPTRVYVNKSITVRAGNTNPAATVIKGEWDPVTTNGPGAVRCVVMRYSSRLIGFTLTNGAAAGTEAHASAQSGGGVRNMVDTDMNPVLSNCVIIGNAAIANSGGHGGGALGVKMYDCKIIDNVSREYGGGAHNCVLRGCVIEGNTGGRGGGAYNSELYGCTIENNTGGSGGGGVYNCPAVSNCVLESNRAGGFGDGGAARDSTLYDCIVKNNSTSSGSGGGARGGTLYNCAITGNRAQSAGATQYSTLYNCVVAGNQALNAGGEGGGAQGGTLRNCAITGNSAPRGGGTHGGTLLNSIVYNNTASSASNNYWAGTMTWSCSVPLAAGAGNIEADPKFIDPGSGYGASHIIGDYRMKKISPCLNKGSNQDYMTFPADPRNRDLDGGPRILHNTVDMGAYELRVPRGSVFSVD